MPDSSSVKAEAEFLQDMTGRHIFVRSMYKAIAVTAALMPVFIFRQLFRERDRLLYFQEPDLMLQADNPFAK